MTVRPEPPVPNAFLPPAGPEAAAAFVALCGAAWPKRMAGLAARARTGQRGARALARHHRFELALDRQARGAAPASPAEALVGGMAAEAVAVHGLLGRDGRRRLRARLAAGLAGEAAIAPLLHLFRTAALQRARGFAVHHAGLADGAPFDLLLARDGAEAELACDSVSAEEGRDLHRGAWTSLLDRIDPDLQTWLAAHPGRYLLKLTLPQGLRDDPRGLATLHARIRAMLEGSRRADQDEAAVLRLDPLMLAGAQAAELGLMGSLRQAFGTEAHLAVTQAGGGVFVMAARAGRANEVAAAVRRRLAAVAPRRLTGTRPGIIAMLVEDTEPAEWRELRERLELEGEARQFLAQPAARFVVAVSCVSREELLGAAELRFRNPAHPAARLPALAPAVLSTP